MEILDGEKVQHLATIFGCPEASGVVCAQKENLFFAASRDTGKILMIDALTHRVLRELQVGSAPSGLAWDRQYRELFVADVQDNNARLIDPYSGKLVSFIQLPGRLRWCAYSTTRDQFLVNVHEPVGISMLAPESLSEKAFLPISVDGPHGLDIDDENGIAYVACDDKAVVVLDIASGREGAVIPIGGGPDVIWLNVDRHRLYCAIGKPGVIEVIDTRRVALIKRVDTKEGAHTFTFDRIRQRLYSFLPKRCRVAVYKET